ncbi:L-serine ammonia-lyase, iron-sulfur-dependent subunit beta [Coriobacteriia bacterium Es71-Z0120]|uniref:L-serine ammonia-lyase, iron-sulfur-dependent subunit beta n=1 Tax=Parvivirga hydrogeniphila TaxID=2939460 RepID=UPI002260C037|nr:L-serine ammonia-lyase, iron-sulfur-dependent subunit beta [Parvivirga hydrogeniphila]MCL4078168.1 L-serine ammonia-lyase, iron-sulfur-dependent subunit beta [Parvivirga hydrogeniphila]
MPRQRSLFDIIGPVMIGPSSSHTAGAARLGALARAIVGGTPRRARVTLHGSFATTGRGHGTDRALAAGLLGMRPDDERLPDALELANASGLEVTFVSGDLGDVHPNTARLELTDAFGRAHLVQGSSLGGGDVVVTLIDDFPVEVTGELPLLVVVHHDQPGVVAAVTARLAADVINIASMQVSRERRGARALMLIETDERVPDEAIAGIAAIDGVVEVRSVPAV